MHRLLVVLAVMGVGCDGSISGDPMMDDPIDGLMEGECENPLETQLPPVYRSLTGAQYSSVLSSAFPSAEAAVDAMPNPWLLSEASTGYTTDAASLKMNQNAVETLLDGTGNIASEAREAIRGGLDAIARVAVVV